MRLLTLIGACALLLACEQKPKPWARAYVIDDLSQAIGGPKAGATIGDLRIENDKIRLAINGQGVDIAAGGVQRWGGYVMDGDIQRPTERPDDVRRGEDRLVQLVPAFDIRTAGFDVRIDGEVYTPVEGSIEIVRDGRDGGGAEVLVRGILHNILPIMRVLPVVSTTLPVLVETRYILKPGVQYLEIVSRFVVGVPGGAWPESTFDLEMRPLEIGDSPALSATETDSLGDWFFAGASLDLFGPGTFGFSSDTYVERQWLAGKTTVEKPLAVDWVGAVADEIGYALVVTEGALLFPLIEGDFTYTFGAILTDTTKFDVPGASISYRRYLVVDDGDIAGLWDHVLALRPQPAGRLEGKVFDPESGQAASGWQVIVFEHPRYVSTGELVQLPQNYDAAIAALAALPASEVSANGLIPLSRFTTDARYGDRRADGSFSGRLPVGDYLLLVSGPGNVRGTLTSVKVPVNDTARVQLTGPALGTVRYEIFSTGPLGPNEPVKLTFLGQRGVGVGDPVLGEPYLPAGISQIIHSRYGRGEVRLPAGVYDVVAGRGYEYDTWQHAVRVEPGQTVSIRGQINRVVDTGGWIAADLHVHSYKSPDASQSEHQRVLGALVEGIEYLVNTDHDVITNYHPAVLDLDARELLFNATGLELSDIWGHFISFPMIYDESKPYGGRINWGNPSPSKNLPEYTPQDIFDALRGNVDRKRLRQSSFVLMNHSQDSPTGYLRSFGFRQMSGQFGSTEIIHAFNPVVNAGGIIASSGEENFSWDFDGMDVLNGGSVDDYRTATTEEVATPTPGDPMPQPKPFLPTIIRTWDEQKRIASGELKLVKGERGLLEEYMTLLVMGKRLAGVAVSDSHSKRKEIGKFRTYVYTGTDDPATLTDDAMTTALKAARAIAMIGPFVEFWIEGQPIGSEVSILNDAADMRIRIQAPGWVSVDRVEIYGNGMLVGDLGKDSTDEVLPCDARGLALNPDTEVLRLDVTLQCKLSIDTVFVVVAMGYSGLSPQITPEAGPGNDSQNLAQSLGQILKAWLDFDADVVPLSGVEKTHEIYPYGIANAIWVDVDGVDRDGDGRLYDGPGFIPATFDEDDEEDEGALLAKQIIKWAKRGASR